MGGVNAARAGMVGRTKFTKEELGVCLQLQWRRLDMVPERTSQQMAQTRLEMLMSLCSCDLPSRNIP
jgi:hypothetical protein